MIEDYNKYKYSKKELIKYFVQGEIRGVFVAYLFYSNVVGMLMMIPYGFYYVKNKKKELIKKRKWQLNLEFKDALISISSALNAGYSIENAFEEAGKDLKLMYAEDSLIVLEFQSLINQIQMNITIEKILEDFARRSKIEDIDNFSAVFTTAKRTGGDLIKIIHNSGNSISQKIETRREIQTMITAKRFEARIMNLIPFAIILYLKFCSPSFLDPLYNNISGFFIMTVLLIIYLFACKIAERIMDIEV